MYQFFNIDGEVRVSSSRKVGRALGPDAPHYPNKAERRELARICQKSGMTEEEVRERKEYRQALSAAQKTPMKPSGHRQAIERKRALRTIAKSLGLPTWHPDVLQTYKEQPGRLFSWMRF